MNQTETFNMDLPHSKHLNLEPLSKIFSKTSTTYKFHWFLAILESIEEENFIPTKEVLFIKMYGMAVSSDYFHLSFGSQDKIQENSFEMFEQMDLPQDVSRSEFEKALIEFWGYDTAKLIFHFDKSVPHWFLSPWFSKKNKAQIYLGSQASGNTALYSLYNEFIEINPLWKNYLKQNLQFLRNFCYGALAAYLQKKNPDTEMAQINWSESTEEISMN